MTVILATARQFESPQHPTNRSFFLREAPVRISFWRRIDKLPKPCGSLRQRGRFRGGHQFIDESFLAKMGERETLTRDIHRHSGQCALHSEQQADRTRRLASGFSHCNGAPCDFVDASQRLEDIYQRHRWQR